MSWTALVPLKGAGTRKERLAGALEQSERDAVVDEMFERVLAVLSGHPRVGQVVILSPDDPGGGLRWIADEGRGLNPELEAARAQLGAAPLFVIHADLPRLEAADIDALLDAADHVGAAIAPDEAGTGTNALAPAPGQPFRFGRDSFALHRADAPHAAIVRTLGLGFDVDLPADLARYRS